MIRKYIRKPYRIKRKKSVFKNRFFGLGILILMIIGSISYFLIFSSIFQIKEIKISGNKEVSTEEIKNLIEEGINQNFFFFSTKSIFFVNLDKIKEGILEKFLQVSEINLKRKFPDALIVEVKEREGVAIFCQQDCFSIDKQGVIFNQVSEVPEKYLKIKKLNLTEELKLGNKVIEKKIISQILDIEKRLKELDIEIKEFSIVSEERLNAKTSENWEIYFNSKEDINWQITELRLVLEKQIPLERRGDIEYIDLRFSKVFYKYR